MAGQKRTVASDKTQQQLPQGNALVNAGGISSLISSSLQPHRPHQSHQSPYPYSSAAYPIHQALQSTGASGAPTGHPSTGASPPSSPARCRHSYFKNKSESKSRNKNTPSLRLGPKIVSLIPVEARWLSPVLVLVLVIPKSSPKHP